MLQFSDDSARFSDSDQEEQFSDQEAQLSDGEACGTSTVQYYNNDYTLPVYKYTRKGEKLGIEQLGKIMFNENINERIVCSRQPTSVCHNSVFIVDLHVLNDPYDIRADDNGSWNRTGSPITYISVHKNSSGHQIMVKAWKFFSPLQNNSCLLQTFQFS